MVNLIARKSRSRRATERSEKNCGEVSLDSSIHHFAYIGYLKCNLEGKHGVNRASPTGPDFSSANQRWDGLSIPQCLHYKSTPQIFSKISLLLSASDFYN